MSYNNFVCKKWQNICNIFFFLGEPLFGLTLYNEIALLLIYDIEIRVYLMNGLSTVFPIDAGGHGDTAIQVHVNN